MGTADINDKIEVKLFGNGGLVSMGLGKLCELNFLKFGENFRLPIQLSSELLMLTVNLKADQDVKKKAIPKS